MTSILLAEVATQTSFTWQFGGPLAGIPQTTAWRILGAVALVGAIWILVCYFWTLVRLRWGARILLSAMRLVQWLAILAVLAAPTRVEKRDVGQSTRPLALLLDRSASMTRSDYRGQRRIDDALRRWHALAPSAESACGTPKIFAFANRVTKISSLEEEPAAIGADQTRLFGAIQEVLEQAPPGGWGAVVTLTDGLDTCAKDSAAEEAAVATRATVPGTPLYFVVGTNLVKKEKPFFAWKEMTVPPQVAPRSTFTLALTADSYQTRDHAVPVRVRIGDHWQAADSVFVKAGHRVSLWQTQIAADRPGLLTIDVEANENGETIRARTEVAVMEPAKTTRILYYEGALDWSRRFLWDILRRDPSFEFESIVNVKGPGSTEVASGPGAPRRLPESAEALREYQVVVLANAAAEQFSEKQQQALSEWVKQGGTLLFLAPDDRAASGYAGTELEKLLPIVFPRTTSPVLEDARVRAFRSEMVDLGYSDAAAETKFADYASQIKAVQLSEFDWESKGREIFSVDTDPPQPLFAGYATVLKAKPGAEVLARHPVETNPAGTERAILFAVQRYGRGQAAALTCDALWRWKMHQQSGQRVVEQFWQELFAWLGRHRGGEGALRIENLPLTVDTGRVSTFSVKGNEAAPALTTVENENDRAASPLTAEAKDGLTERFQWTPSHTGMWRVVSRNEQGDQISQWVEVRAGTSPPVTGEDSGLPPDDAVMQALAAQTRGAVLGAIPPTEWTVNRPQPTRMISERRQLTWQAPWVLCSILGLFALELIVRRIVRLL